LQAQQNSIHYGINTLSNFVVNTGLIILFVAVLKRGVIGVLEANLITAVLYFIYVAIAYIPKLKLNLKKEYVVPAYKYSLPLVPHLLAGWSTGLLDRLLINGMRGEGDTGLFSVGKQFSSILSTLTNAVNTAFSPWLFESNNNKRYDDIRIVGSLAVLAYSIIAFIISLFSPEILQFMVTEEFRGVWTIIPVLSFAMVLNGIYFIFVDVLFINKTNLVFIVSISTLVLNIVLNLLLIPKFGIEGSAWACFISYFIKSIISLRLYKRSNKDISFNWMFMYGVCLSLFALCFINYALIEVGFWLSLLLKAVILLGIGGLFFVIYKEKVLYAWDMALTLIKKK